MPHTDTKHLVQRQFSQNPQGYVASPTHAQGADLARLIELIQPQPDWTMLDIATGGGHTARTFAPYVARVIASDLTAAMLHTAQKHLQAQGLINVVYQRVDAEALPFRDDSLDLITCRIAPHHFPDIPHFVHEMARAVRPGGIVAVVDQIVPEKRKPARYINAFERLRDPGHAWAYSLRRWQGFFHEAGLTVWHVEPFEKRMDLFAWALLMGCTPDKITRLRAMLIQAPPEPAAWLKGEFRPSGDASFSIHQAIILGRKDEP